MINSNYGKLIFLGVFFLFSGEWMKSQNLQQNQDNKTLLIIAKPSGKNILLRWAPHNYYTWKLANKYGYTLEKYTIVRNGNIVENPEKTTLTTSPLIPASQEMWEMKENINDYYLGIAGALFGESLEMKSSANTMMRMINRTQENDMRFGYALYAAGLCFPAACMAALGFVDTTAAPDEKYLYKLFVNVPDSVSVIIDTAFILSGLAQNYALPVINGFFANFQNNSVLLQWQEFSLNNPYIAYALEKSTDGKTFFPASDKPIVNLEEQEQFSAYSIVSFVDTISPETTVYYRVSGYDAFGAKGPASAIISGKSSASLTAPPEITTVFEEKETILIQWNFPLEEEHKITGFYLLKGKHRFDNNDTLYFKIAPDKRMIKIKKRLSPSNYFYISAKDHSGHHWLSQPYFYQPEDSVPPQMPQAVSGTVDSCGIAVIRWKMNQEPDLDGYRVFRAAVPDGEYVQITTQIEKENRFFDTVSVNTAKSLYYKIVAVDRRGNVSQLSVAAEVQRTQEFLVDVPQLKEYTINKGKITIYWVETSDENIDSIVIVRKIDTVEKRVSQCVWGKQACTSFSEVIPENIAVFYSLAFVSKTGRYSPFSKPIEVMNFELDAPQLVAAIDKSHKKILLHWQGKNTGNATTYFLYKKKDNEPLTLFKIIGAPQQSFSDGDLLSGSVYEYRVVCGYNNNAQSGFSNPEIISY